MLEAVPLSDKAVVKAVSHTSNGNVVVFVPFKVKRKVLAFEGCNVSTACEEVVVFGWGHRQFAHVIDDGRRQCHFLHQLNWADGGNNSRLVLAFERKRRATPNEDAALAGKGTQGKFANR